MIGKQGSDLGQVHIYSRVKPVHEIPALPSFDNWINNGITEINKQ
jgi:hypothetical protein